MNSNFILFPHAQVFLEELDYGFGLLKFFLAKVVYSIQSISQGAVSDLTSSLPILEYFIIEDAEVQADWQFYRTARL